MTRICCNKISLQYINFRHATTRLIGINNVFVTLKMVTVVNVMHVLRTGLPRIESSGVSESSRSVPIAVGSFFGGVVSSIIVILIATCIAFKVQNIDAGNLRNIFSFYLHISKLPSCAHVTMSWLQICYIAIITKLGETTYIHSIRI